MIAFPLKAVGTRVYDREGYVILTAHLMPHKGKYAEAQKFAKWVAQELNREKQNEEARDRAG